MQRDAEDRLPRSSGNSAMCKYTIIYPDEQMLPIRCRFRKEHSRTVVFAVSEPHGAKNRSGCARKNLFGSVVGGQLQYGILLERRSRFQGTLDIPVAAAVVVAYGKDLVGAVLELVLQQEIRIFTVVGSILLRFALP